MAFLNTDQMVELAQVFKEAYQHTLGLFGGEELTHVQSFVTRLVMEELPYSMVTPSGGVRARNQVFADPKVRDFVLLLTFHYSARWGSDPDKRKALNTVLAQASAMQVPVSSQTSDLVAMPPDIADSYAAFEDVVLVLGANPWLVSLLLLQLFISVEL